MAREIQSKTDRVASALMERVFDGTYPPGAQLPPMRQLAVDFKVSSLTASMAIASLSAAGLVTARQGAGTFVSLKPKASTRTLTIGIATVTSDLRAYPEYGETSAPCIPYVTAGFQEYFHDGRAVPVTLLCPPDSRPADKPMFYKKAANRDVDGWMLIGQFRPRDIDIILERDVPLVICEWLVPERSVPTILINRSAGLRLLLKHLVEFGHRKIKIINYMSDCFAQRYGPVSYMDVARTFGLGDSGDNGFHAIDNTAGAPAVPAYDRAVADAMAERPTAIVAHDEVIANRVIRYCYDNGLTIPGDLSLVSMNDMVPGSHPFALTTLNTPQALREMTQEACRLLDHCIRRKTLTNERSLIGPTLIPGESVASPRK